MRVVKLMVDHSLEKVSQKMDFLGRNIEACTTSDPLEHMFPLELSASPPAPVIHHLYLRFVRVEVVLPTA